MGSSNGSPAMVGSTIRRQATVTCCALIALGLVAAGSFARAANIDVGSGTRIDVPLKSMKDLRDRGLVKQRFDYL